MFNLSPARTCSALATLSLSLLFACSTHDSGEQGARAAAPLVNGLAVTWTGLVNASVQGDSLVKTGGQPQMEDSGAVSAQQIPSGEAWFQFTMSETSTFKFVGFGHSPTWPKAVGIDFSFRMQSGHVDVYENNVWVDQNTGVPGDTFAIHVNGNTIEYQKNAVTFHTTAKTPTYPLIVAASLIDSGATIQGAQIETPSTCGGGTDAATTTVSPKIVVPAYFGTGDVDPVTGSTYWSEIVGTRGAAVVVPDCSFADLPHQNPDAIPAVKRIFDQAHAAGQLVLGYVDTRFGTAPLGSGIENGCAPTQSNPSLSDPLVRVEDWYSAYATFVDANGNATPGLDGIFFDDGPSYDPGIQQTPGIPTDETGFQTYYNRLFASVKNAHAGAKLFLNASLYPYGWVLNPSAYTIGSPMQSGGQAAVADFVNTFEGPQSTYENSFKAEYPGAVSGDPPAWWTDGSWSLKTSHIVFNVQDVTSLRAEESLAAQRKAGLVYFLDCRSGDSNCPTSGGYGRLPSYWSTEAADYSN